MQAEFKIIQGKDFLKATSSGIYDLAEMIELLGRIAADNAPHGDHDLLIDLRKVVGPPLTYDDISSMVKVMLENRASFRNQIAFLVRPDALERNVSFAELYAGNRNFDLQVFTEFEEAIFWLMHS